MDRESVDGVITLKRTRFVNAWYEEQVTVKEEDVLRLIASGNYDEEDLNLDNLTDESYAFNDIFNEFDHRGRVRHAKV